MARAVQITRRDDRRGRRGRTVVWGGGALLVSLLTLPASAQAASPLNVPEAPVEPVATVTKVAAPIVAVKAAAAPVATVKAVASAPAAPTSTTTPAAPAKPAARPTTTAKPAAVRGNALPAPSSGEASPPKSAVPVKVEVPAVPPVPGLPPVPAAPKTVPLAPVPALPVPAQPASQPATHDPGAAPRSGSATGGSPAGVAAASTPPSSWHRTNEGAHAPGTGGSIARAASVGITAAAASGKRVNSRRMAAPTHAAVSGRPFALVDAPAAAGSTGGPGISPDVDPFGPATISTAEAGLLATILLIAGGALLIALMCCDAVGVGPRHEYLRRRAGRWRLPWH